MNVLVTGRLPDDVLALIKKEHNVEINLHDRPMDRERIISGIIDKDGILCMITDRIGRELLDKAQHLKIIANFGVGFDNIDVQAATERGIPVTNTPGILTDATADLTFALILASGRRVVEGDKHTRAGKFKYWAPLLFLGHEVTGKTLGIVGMGRIGRAVAKRAFGFDMKLIYTKRKRLGKSEEKALNIEYVNFETLLKESDFVTLHVPLLPETRHLIGENELKLMKSSSFLINTSRGPVVNETDLVKALKNKMIKGAGLDVYENEPELTPGLIDLDNVVLLPHMGSQTVETRKKMALMATENLLSGLNGKTPPNCLNCDELRTR